MPPVSSLVPLEWPDAWQEAGLAHLLEGTAFNCVLLPASAPAALEGALRERFAVLRTPAWRKLAEIDWRSPGDVVLIGDAGWPSVGAGPGSDEAEAGPTGLPWLESNGWLIRMARDLAPQSAVWIRSGPPEDADRIDAGLYLLAQCEAWAHGARRPLWMPPRVAAGLAQGNAAAMAWWRRLAANAGWWVQRAESASWPTAARLLVISGFAGADAQAATEFLNLAARRNLPWRVVLPERAVPALRGMAAAVYVDQQPLEGGLLQGLTEFVRLGGLLVCLKEAAAALQGLSASAQTHPRYEIRQAGRGRVALSREGSEDPYVMAQDVHLLMSRRHDLVRLFNPGSILAWPAVSPDRRRLRVHLINYSRRGAAHDVAVQSWREVKAASIEMPGMERQNVPVRREAGGWEVALEGFDTYCGLDLEGNWDG
ncbi:MAG: hypothetical protein N2036_00950 [Bryobacteraceae bacterium]|nr:hypothetical protein [Bryobacteraceae bacterium]